MLSVQFLLHIILEAPGGKHRRMTYTDHRVCKREQLDDSHYLDIVARSLYHQFKNTNHEVVRVVVENATLPGNEHKAINYIADFRGAQGGEAA